MQARQFKVQADLNNCCVNVALPEIMKGIEYHACIERNEAIQKENDANFRKFQSILAHVQQEYNLLKNHFNTFYGTNLNWDELHKLLTSKINNNSTAAQFIMGPVLRAYMGEEMEANGRYPIRDLEHHVKANLLIKLGINAKVSTYGNTGLLQETETELKHSFATVTAHGRGQHWERVAPTETYVDDRKPLPSHCETIGNAYELLREGGSASHIQDVLSIVKNEVRKIATNNELKQGAKQESKAAAPSVAETKPRNRPETTVSTSEVKSRENKINTPTYNQFAATMYQQALNHPKKPAALSDQKIKSNIENLVKDTFEVCKNVNVDDETLANLNSAKARALESDAEFAKRLQAAEIKLATRRRSR